MTPCTTPPPLIWNCVICNVVQCTTEHYRYLYTLDLMTWQHATEQFLHCTGEQAVLLWITLLKTRRWLSQAWEGYYQKAQSGKDNLLHCFTCFVYQYLTLYSFTLTPINSLTIIKYLASEQRVCCVIFFS